MAINLYSNITVMPSQTPGIEISADIPLNLVPDADKSPSASANQALLEPLRLAADATLDKLRTKDKNLKVQASCEVPIGAGLGSSASTTVATISAVAKSRNVVLNREDIFQLAFVSENYLHGKPSGVDQATCTYGGIIQFEKPAGIKPLKIKRPPLILVCDSGVHRSTKALVGSVVKRSNVETERFQSHLEEVSEISAGVVKAMKNEDAPELGSLMSRNHELLRQIGVSTPMLDHLVEEAKRVGALGAKLTGAGGGGCVIALCVDKTSRLKVARRLKQEGGRIYNVALDEKGVE